MCYFVADKMKEPTHKLPVHKQPENKLKMQGACTTLSDLDSCFYLIVVLHLRSFIVLTGFDMVMCLCHLYQAQPCHSRMPLKNVPNFLAQGLISD